MGSHQNFEGAMIVAKSSNVNPNCWKVSRNPETCWIHIAMGQVQQQTDDAQCNDAEIQMSFLGLKQIM